MEAKNTVVIFGTEAFARGEMVNLALSTGALVLERTTGNYSPRGCYLTPVLPFSAFDRLMVSWGADTPRGTSLEAEVRVFCGDKWSGWYGFGRWSPFVSRAGVHQPEADPAWMDGDVLCVPGGAVKAQVRVFLYSEDPQITCALRLLAVSVRPKAWNRQEGPALDRALRIPAYSQLNRDPAFGAAGCLPVCVAMLMNRWGEDILPEELALAMYDEEAGCGNRAFAAAAAGAYGYEAYLAWLDLAGLKAQVKAGYGVICCVRYTNDPASPDGLPWLEGADGVAPWHTLVVRGFVTDRAAGDRPAVLVNDPFSPNDAAAERCYDLEQFLACWTGACCLVHRKRKGAGNGHPERFSAVLRPVGPVGVYRFEAFGQPYPLPADFLGTPQRPAGTLAYTLAEPVAHATTAHKRFYYAAVTPEGNIQLPAQVMAEGKKITVYAIDNTGSTLVAELKP